MRPSYPSAAYLRQSTNSDGQLQLGHPLGSEMCSSAGELLANRCSICLSFCLLLIAVSTAENRSSACRNATENVVFIDFVPCSLNGTSVSTLAAREFLEKCDILVQAAIELAVERINRNPNILANTTIRVQPVQLPDFGEVSNGR